MALYRHLTANQITLTPMPFLRELAMEAYLFENPEILVLDSENLSSVSILDAEVQITGGRPSITRDGRIDLLAFYGESTAAVVELKHCELCQDHLSPLEDYLKDEKKMKDIISKYIDSENYSLLGILVGTSISSELKSKIEAGHLINESIPTAAITLSRFRGQDNNIYVITDVLFRNTSRNYDRTKYMFENEILGKSRLVLKTISKYVENNPEITMAELTRSFPKNLQGSHGCFHTVEKAQQIWEGSGHRRHFLKPDELIRLSDTTVAVSTQWGIDNR